MSLHVFKDCHEHMGKHKNKHHKVKSDMHKGYMITSVPKLFIYVVHVVCCSDLSFNKLTGEVNGANAPTYTDLSYNNFTWSSSCKLEKPYEHEIFSVLFS
ncbi:hypothetical protein YC2023_083199 [Brassica napus]